MNLIIMAGIMTIVVIATRSPTLGQQFAKLIEVSVVLCLLVYVYACIAVWHYDKSPSSAARLKGYRTLAAAAIFVCLFVIIRGGTSLLIISAGIILLTYPLYRFFQHSALRPAALTQVADERRE